MICQAQDIYVFMEHLHWWLLALNKASFLLILPFFYFSPHLYTVSQIIRQVCNFVIFRQKNVDNNEVQYKWIRPSNTSFEQFSSTFMHSKLRYWKKNAKRSIIWVSRVIRQTGGIIIRIGIFFKISMNYALNMWLVAFARKLYQICEHRYNNFSAINLILK